MGYYLQESYDAALKENENLKRALLESHRLLACILLKNGGSINLGYEEFYKVTLKEYEFSKHEDYQNDSIIFKIKESAPSK